MNKTKPNIHRSWHARSIELWGPGWAICRKTPKNLERYARCLTKSEYNKAFAAHAESQRNEM
jgi:hypothetical protein